MDVSTPVADAPKKPAKFPKKEFDIRENAIPQAADVVMPGLHEPVHRPETHIQQAEAPLTDDYAAQLAFNEEPITIRIEPGREKFAPKYVEAWVQGKGIEVWIQGRWVESKGIPVGMPVTIKRKYAEVLAGSVIDSVQTKVVKPTGPEEDYENRIVRSTSANAPFTILSDRSPYAQPWRERLFRLTN